MNPVEQAHPILIVRCPCSDPGCTLAATGGERSRAAEDYEDIDELPIAERAAICLSIAACTVHGNSVELGVPVEVIDLAHDYIDVDRFADDLNAAERYAEAEARMREVRP